MSSGPGGKISRRTLLAGGGAAFAFAASRASAALESNTLTLALTPVLMTSDLDLLDRLRAYLSAATGLKVELLTRRTYQEITSLVVSGQVHAAWICGYPFVQYRERLSLVAVPVWQGAPLYRSYLIVDRDRQAEGWEALRGDIHAYSDPDSNSGYLVTTALLAENGIRPEGYFRKTFFTYGHRNVVRAVASGLAHSGSVDGYVWEVMRRVEPELIERTRVVRASEPLGFPPIACARELAGGEPVRLLARALLAMEGDEDGRAVLDMLQLDGFTQAGPDLFSPIAEKVAMTERYG